MRIARLLARPLDVVLPPACASCGLPGEVVCDRCRDALAGLGPPGCARCGHPWSLDVDVCAECPRAVDVARQAVAYAGSAPALIAALKDHGFRSLAAPIADAMAARIPAPPAGVTLVPVPLAGQRLHERGFNQAALIARELGRAWGLPVAAAIARVREAPAQRGASATERHAQVRAAFAARGAAPRVACLVDDVHTTGATLGACARALRAGGAKHVGAVAFARVIRPLPGGTI
jgi:ComF family protein